MNKNKRLIRRHNTNKVMRRRFKERICNYCGSIPRSYTKFFDKSDFDRMNGILKKTKNHKTVNKRCRCEWCKSLGYKESIADLDFDDMCRE